MNTEIFQKNMQMLNPEQREVVEALDGPVMVIAGPGTGKTQIIGMRTANLILKAGVDPKNIMITTFTDAGVIAIRKRLVSLIGAEAYKIYVATIHSFADDVIRSFPEKFLEQKLTRAIDQIETLEILKNILESLLEKGELEYLTSYGDPLYYLRNIESNISALKREGVSVKKLEKSLKEFEENALLALEQKRQNKRIKNIEKHEQEHNKLMGKQQEFLRIFTSYQEVLRARECYDFNDMINFVLERFHVDEELRYHYAESYQYIMLDEYQDTNNPQNEIISLILSVAETPNIMVVGDDDQSIYRFQGANIENMLDFTTRYPEAKIIVLEKNYRSVQGVLDSAGSLIEHNSERLVMRLPGLSKNLISQSEGQNISSVHLFEAGSQAEEKIFLKNKIQSLLDNGIPADEIAVIVRSNKEVKIYCEFLESAGIPIRSKLQSNILESESIILLIKMLQIIENPRVDDSIFLDMMRSRISGISPSLCLKFAQMISQKNYALASGQKLSYSDVFLHLENYNEYFSQEELQQLETFWNTILKLQVYASEHHILRLLQKLLKDFGMIEFLEEQKLHEAIDDVYSFYTKMQSLSEFNPQMKLQDFLAKLDLYRVYGFQVSREILSGKKQSVEILTAHGSKGLEYSHVFIPGMHAGNWEGKMIRELIKLPENLSGEGLQYQEYADMSEKEKKDFLKNRQLEEDRRLFFVALTRAKKHVTLSFSAQSDGKLRIVSPFISEIGEYESVSEAISAQEIQDLETQELSLKEALYEYDEEILTKIQENLKNYKLSVSDLNTFLISPRDFLRSSLLKYPFMQTESAVFGTMIHRSLELFYKKMQETGKIQDEGYLLFVYEKQLEKELLTHEERERLKKRGKEALSGYYKTYNGNFVTPLKTEYRFSRKNIFFEGIPLTGVMDKIELLSDEFVPDMGNGSLFTQAVKITDYKTGSVKYMGEIKGVDQDGNKDTSYQKGRYGRQLMFYKLLFENDFELSSHYSLGALELDFCEGKNGNYKRLSVEFIPEEYEDFKLLVKEKYAQMTDIHFWKEFLGIS